MAYKAKNYIKMRKIGAMRKAYLSPKGKAARVQAYAGRKYRK
nr:MAG: hypothetical protein [Microvirus sp.]